MELVYTGKCHIYNDKGKTIIGYKYINKESEEELLFGKKLLSYESIGTIISAEKTETGVKGPYSYIGKYTNEPRVQEWVDQDKLFDIALESLREAKTTLTSNYEQAIKALKIIYFNCPSASRTYLISKIHKDIIGRN